MYKCSNPECNYHLEDTYAEYASPTVTKNHICPICGSKIVFTNELISHYKKYKKSMEK